MIKNVLSYHLCIETEQNRIFSGPVPSKEDVEALKGADAVILPQGCRQSLYQAARRYCPRVFPNYDMYFKYPGKTGQHALFEKMQVPHPYTETFQALQDFSGLPASFSYPFVFKFPWGGEGANVFLVGSAQELDECLQRASQWEHEGKKGFLLQEYIPSGGRSLRVVVIDKEFYPYWRQVEDGGFYTNLARGAVIDYEAFPDLQKRAVLALRDFCGRTGINLAGFDFLFSETKNRDVPLFLEINYCFRCKGLGGVGKYHQLLEKGIKEWLQGQV